MNWSILLQRVLDFLIHVDHETLDVHVWDPPRNRWLKKTPSPGRKGRIRFVFSGYRRGNGRKAVRHTMTVYRAKLVWVYFNRRLPNGPIDHKDENRLNDHPSNLQEHTWYESNLQGNLVQVKRQGLGEGWRLLR